MSAVNRLNVSFQFWERAAQVCTDVYPRRSECCMLNFKCSLVVGHGIRFYLSKLHVAPLFSFKLSETFGFQFGTHSSFYLAR